MRIERVDDKTVKCFISNEELNEYEIDYKDFIMRSEKAKEVVQEIIMQAEEEVGYKPPKFAFDLQIMMVPDQGMVLTFSEKEPADLGDSQQIMECLQEMKKMLQKTKSQLGNAKEALQEMEAAQTASAGKPEIAAKDKHTVPDFAVFAFRNAGRVMEYASVLPKTLRVKSALYVMNDVYYLYMQKGGASYERYSRACVQALEFANLFGAEAERLQYLKEHGECLIEEQALKKMRVY